jgi:hypothetical protein
LEGTIVDWFKELRQRVDDKGRGIVVEAGLAAFGRRGASQPLSLSPEG